NSASSVNIKTRTMPVAASGLWRATRGNEMAVVVNRAPSSRAKARIYELMSTPHAPDSLRRHSFSLSYSRIYFRVQQVRQEIHCHIRQSNRENAPLNQIVVTVRNSLNCQPANARPGKNGLRDDSSGKQCAELQT